MCGTFFCNVSTGLDQSTYESGKSIFTFLYLQFKYESATILALSVSSYIVRSYSAGHIIFHWTFEVGILFICVPAHETLSLHSLSAGLRCGIHIWRQDVQNWQSVTFCASFEDGAEPYADWEYAILLYSRRNHIRVVPLTCSFYKFNLSKRRPKLNQPKRS